MICYAIKNEDTGEIIESLNGPLIVYEGHEDMLNEMIFSRRYRCATNNKPIPNLKVVKVEIREVEDEK